MSVPQPGVILGPPQYMAPEQARNISDPRSDVYSLGVVLYQMLLGRPPFLAEQSIDIIVKHLNEPPPAFSAIWCRCPTPLTTSKPPRGRGNQPSQYSMTRRSV